MKKILPLSLFILLSFFAFSQKTFHDFKVVSILGDTVDLSIFKGQKVMVVNTASLCGIAYQYTELQQLFIDYKKYNFTIIVFPSNDFGNQEPGSNEDILKFCEDNFNVSFPMMSKIHVAGSQIHPLYQWLTSQNENGVQDAPVQWNFQKFLIDEDGSWYDMLPSATSPLDPIITTWIAQGSGVENEVIRVSNLSVYPTPAKDHFNVIITVEELANVVVKLMNLQGQLVEELYNGIVESDLRINYNTDIIKSGLYLVIAEINNEQKTFQLRVDK